MSHEILSVLEYMEKEKGISRPDMIEAISAAIAGAAQRGVNAGQNVRIEINPKTGSLKGWTVLEVVDSVADDSVEIHVEKARQVRPDAQIGETIEKEIDPASLGRIAAQTARQAIMQRIRQFDQRNSEEDTQCKLSHPAASM